MKSTDRPVRRSQQERREATRATLLDAAIGSLVELGYASMSAREVSRRAGLSQGAQQHYFPSKGALVEAAFERLTQRMAEHVGAVLAVAGSDRERAEEFLDRMWDIQRHPAIQAGYDMLNMARTDVEAARRVSRFFNQISLIMQQVVAQLLPEYARKPGFVEWVQTAMATIRGTAIMQHLPDLHPGYAYAEWKVIRASLLRHLDALQVV